MTRLSDAAARKDQFNRLAPPDSPGWWLEAVHPGDAEVRMAH